MKKFINFIKKCKRFADKEYLTYTLLFLIFMCVLYAYSIYAGMLTSPNFTYAEF